MTAYAHDTITPVITSRPAQRAGAGSVRLSQRDIDGLLLHRIVVRDLPGTAFTPGLSR